MTKTITKRFFNQIEVDEQRLVLTKTSDEYSKFVAEVQWYLSIPEELKRYIPKVIGHSLDPVKAYVELEYLTWPTLSSLLVSGFGELSFWQEMFQVIFHFIDDMRFYTDSSSAADRRTARSLMFIDKTTRRLDMLRSDEVFGAFFVADHCINGKWHQPLNSYLAELPNLCESALFSTNSPFTVIHGDLCASNILCDGGRNEIRVIDPRGDFGGRGVYGDYRYDLAKLLHSFGGLYDFIIADLFLDLQLDERSVKWTLNRSAAQTSILELFSRSLRKYSPTDIAAVELIESLLFLSMVPLHRESRDRQIVLLATGIEKFTRCIERQKNS